MTTPTVTERDREMAEDVDDKFALRGLGCLPSETIWHIGATIARVRAEADAAGYARAREQAAKVVEAYGEQIIPDQLAHEMSRIAAAIRALED